MVYEIFEPIKSILIKKNSSKQIRIRFSCSLNCEICRVVLVFAIFDVKYGSFCLTNQPLLYCTRECMEELYLWLILAFIFKLVVSCKLFHSVTFFFVNKDYRSYSPTFRGKLTHWFLEGWTHQHELTIKQQFTCSFLGVDSPNQI